MSEILDAYLKVTGQTKPLDSAPPISPLGAALEVSAGLDPAQTARAGRLAKELGVSEDLVLAAPDEAEKEAIARKLRAFPHLVDWAGRSAVNAAFARTNAEGLAGLFDFIGKGAKRFGKGTVDTGVALGATALASMERQIRDMEAAGDTGPEEGYHYRYPGSEGERPREYARIKSQAAALRSALVSAQGAFDMDELEADSAFGNYVLDFIQAGPQLAGAIGSSILGGPVGAGGFMAAQIFGGQYLDLTEQGVDPDRAAAAGLVNAAVQAPMEAFSLSRFFNIFKTKGLANIFKRAGESVLTDVGTETAQGLPEMLTEKWAKREGVTGGDVGKALRQGFYEGLTLAPYSFLGGAVAALRTNREESRAAAWVERMNQLYAQAQKLLPDRGGDPAALDLPPAILERAGADVTPETRADLVKRLRDAGRSEARAKKDMEILARFASIISWITGTNPNTMIKEGFRFGKEGAEGSKSGLSSSGRGVADTRNRFDETTPSSNLNDRHTSIDELFKNGKSFFQFERPSTPEENAARGLEAMNKVIAEQTDVLDAMFRPEVGGISFYWGTPEGGGIAHLIGRRNAEGQDGEAIARLMPEVIANGQIGDPYGPPGGERRNIFHNGHTAVLSLYKFGGRETWLLTGWKDNAVDAPGAVNAPGDTQTRPSGIQDELGATAEENIAPLGADGKPLFQSQANEAGPRGWTEVLNDGTINIIFTQSQDASTAVHEFAHAFRAIVARTLKLPPDQIADQAAFDSLAENWEAAEAWLARFDDEAALKAEYDKYQKGQRFKGRAFEDLTDDERERARRTAKHEYFARGFEVYLMEGIAPTSGLKKLFEQMKKWLTALYETALKLDVDLNDEVRQFFDQLLATEEELLVEGWRGEMALTPEDMDILKGIVDPAELEHVMKAGDRAKEEAAKQLTAARLKEQVKMRKHWWREAWAAAREHPSQERVKAIIDQGGMTLKSLQDGGYKDADTIRALTKIRPGLVSEKAGIGFDEWAEMMGFEDSGKFIDALLNTPTLKTLAEKYVAGREAEWAEYFTLEAGLTEAKAEARTDKRLAVLEERHKARSRLLRERQEMALRYQEQAERAREIAKFEARARKTMKQKAALSPFKPGGIRADGGGQGLPVVGRGRQEHVHPGRHIGI